jgi:hypothetical protein
VQELLGHSNISITLDTYSVLQGCKKMRWRSGTTGLEMMQIVLQRARGKNCDDSVITSEPIVTVLRDRWRYIPSRAFSRFDALITPRESTIRKCTVKEKEANYDECERGHANKYSFLCWIC